MPYGGFYPENWAVVRKPWTRNVVTLYKMHQKGELEDLVFGS